MSKKRDNKPGHNRTHHLNIASIVQRLPLHRHMSQSQSALVKLSPSWLTWSANHLSTELANQVTLTGLQNGQLVISCANAVSASQIKHQQASLLESLNLSGLANVKRIKIRIDHTYSSTETHSTQCLTEKTESDQQTAHDTSKKNTNPIHINRQNPGSQTIKSIENCQKLTSNDDLSESLERLAKTLKGLD